MPQCLLFCARHVYRSERGGGNSSTKGEESGESLGKPGGTASQHNTQVLKGPETHAIWEGRRTPVFTSTQCARPYSMDQAQWSESSVYHGRAAALGGYAPAVENLMEPEAYGGKS